MHTSTALTTTVIESGQCNMISDGNRVPSGCLVARVTRMREMCHLRPDWVTRYQWVWNSVVQQAE